MRNDRYAWLLASAFALVLVPSVVMAQAPQLASAKKAAPRADAACVDCHEKYEAGMAASLHGKKGDPKTPAAQEGCVSCHGPAGKHADDPEKFKPLQFNKVKASEANAACTSCHASGQHASWDGSKHDVRGVSCVSCHSVHSAKGASQLKASSESQLCSSCHQNVVAKMNRFNHMPVREGKMSCSSCHNTHGSANVKMLKQGNTADQACTSCHTEKRGPVLWEHAPVANSCTTCHDAHGSNNDRMLVAKAPFLCQRCHVTSRHPPTVYNGFTVGTSQNANKITGRNCMNCHQQIHGSNSPNGKALLR